MASILSRPQCVNSLGSSDAIWRQRSGSPLAPSKGYFTRDISANHWNYRKNWVPKMSLNFPGANELIIWSFMWFETQKFCACLWAGSRIQLLSRSELLTSPMHFRPFDKKSHSVGSKQSEHYCKTSSMSRTKSQNLNLSCTLLQLSSLNPLKPRVKLRMRMQLEQPRQAMLQLHLSYQQFYCLLRCDLY